MGLLYYLFLVYLVPALVLLGAWVALFLVVYSFIYEIILFAYKVNLIKCQITKYWLILISIILGLVIQGYPWFYDIDDFDGLVIDETGVPIGGALVTIDWKLKNNYLPFDIFGGKSWGEKLETVEVITGQNGTFSIPGFRKMRPLFKSFSSEQANVERYGYVEDWGLSQFVVGKQKMRSDLKVYVSPKKFKYVRVMIEAKYHYDHGKNLNEYFRGPQEHKKSKSVKFSYLPSGVSLREELRKYYINRAALYEKAARYINYSKVYRYKMLLAGMNCSRRIAETETDIRLIHKYYCSDPLYHRYDTEDDWNPLNEPVNNICQKNCYYLVDLERDVADDLDSPDGRKNASCPTVFNFSGLRGLGMYLKNTKPLTAKEFCRQEPSLALVDHAWREEPNKRHRGQRTTHDSVNRSYQKERKIKSIKPVSVGPSFSIIYKSEEKQRGCTGMSLEELEETKCLRKKTNEKINVTIGGRPQLSR